MGFKVSRAVALFRFRVDDVLSRGFVPLPRKARGSAANRGGKGSDVGRLAQTVREGRAKFQRTSSFEERLRPPHLTTTVNPDYNFKYISTGLKLVCSPVPSVEVVLVEFCCRGKIPVRL